MADSFMSSADQTVTDLGTDNSQVRSEQTAATQYSVAGKSFSDLDSMKTSYEHQETHIKTLESEREADRLRISELESKVSQASTVDELLERIRQGNSESGSASIDMDQITSQVTSHIESGLLAKEKKAKQDSNWQQVCDKLTSSYGDKADDQVRSIAKEFGMSWDEAVSMAQSKPSVFLNLFKMEGTVAPRSSSGSINTSGIPDVERETPRTSVLNLRTDAKRVANYASRLDELYKQRGIL